MATDAYQGGGGWSGGSPLTGGSGGVYGGTDSMLGSYMQSMKQYDPLSGSMKTARPAQSNAQMSSLARSIQAPEGVPAAYNTQPQAATRTASQQAPVQVNVQAPGANYASVVDPQTSLLSRALLANSMQAPAPAAAANGLSLAPGRDARGIGPMQTGAVLPTGTNYTAYTTKDVDGIRYNLAWDANAGQWVPQSRTMIPITGGSFWNPFDALASTVKGSAGVAMNGPLTDTTTTEANGVKVTTSPGDKDQIAEAVRQATESRPDLVSAYHSAMQSLFAKGREQTLQGAVIKQQAVDDSLARAAQDKLDRASAFNLANVLQAPDTSASDAAGRADLARVISKYRAAGLGPEAMSLAAIGARDAGTQATVNKTNHDTAYAEAYNANYGIFADAIRARRDTSIAASGQRLAYDMQGVSQAVSQMTQQASQLGEEAKIKTMASLQPLRRALQAYDLAVATYKADSTQAKEAAAMVLSLGGSLAAAAV